jgi:hypothetical protein
MEPERLDLSALSARADRSAFERRIRSIVDGAAPELARRAGRGGILVLLGAWSRPALAAAATIAVVATATLFAQRSAPSVAPAGTGVVQALGVAEPASRWLDEDVGPSVDDLVMVLERNP